MTTGVDHRPWLIISRTEARALLRLAGRGAEPLDEDTARALNVLERQLRWLAGQRGLDAEQPSVGKALYRQQQTATWRAC